MKTKKRRNFCDINPFFYIISRNKEIVKRHLKNFFSNEKFAKNNNINNSQDSNKFSNCIFSYNSNIIKKGKGIDPVLQENKAVNIKIACSKINGIIIHPGEVFSFWKTVGRITKRKGYKPGRVIVCNKLQPGIGGGLCNLGNTINLLVLHSPLEILEFNKHSDALAPDHGKRVPLSAGTSIFYNYLDYKFKNNTEQDIQLLVWCENDKLYGELRSEKEFSTKYEITEENHHFEKDGNNYYRVSKIYKNSINKKTNEIISKDLIWDNHSKVMFDHTLIPANQIR